MAAQWTAYVKNHLYVPLIIKVPDDDDPTQLMLYDDALATTLGDPTGFIAATGTSAATSAHADLVPTLYYTGTPGLWYAKVLAVKLSNATLTGVVAEGGALFLVIVLPNASRQVSEGTWADRRLAA